ncbi:molybdopterin-guanine dinucleotide biosynthesis protein B [Zobellella sp. DQSA1]|uniref:molybdopterin-guanine dinucleotide biosynthesis protein B n=1 Tax=Zobellella sp. DQSA1 TaxID=3342386 RepID=UPI0035BF496F
MSRLDNHHALLGFAGFSGSGKTTLLRQLVALLNRRQWRIGIIKHSHHDVEQDTPGKDSYELRHAGARQCLLAGPHRSILTYENTKVQEPDLNESLSRLSLDQLDLVLAEGFREAPIPKLEVYRPAHGKPLLCRHDPHILAVATDDAGLDAPVPLLDLNAPEAIATLIEQWLAAGRLHARRD